MVDASDLVRLSVHDPQPAAAIGEAVAPAQLAEGVAGEGVPGALIAGHESQDYVTLPGRERTGWGGEKVRCNPVFGGRSQVCLVERARGGNLHPAGRMSWTTTAVAS